MKTILVSLQKKNTFEAAARASAVSASRWKARVYAIRGVAAARYFKARELKNANIIKLNGYIKRVENASELGLAYYIRFKVFVDEQNVPPELELDEHDEAAVHMLALENETPVGCGRLVFFEGYARIGRVAVLKEYRGRGFAKMICEALIDIARNEGVSKIVLDSQCSAEGLYRKLGFAPEGEVFDDAGIDHIRMVREL